MYWNFKIINWRIKTWFRAEFWAREECCGNGIRHDWCYKVNYLFTTGESVKIVLNIQMMSILKMNSICLLENHTNLILLFCHSKLFAIQLKNNRKRTMDFKKIFCYSKTLTLTYFSTKGRNFPSLSFKFKIFEKSWKISIKVLCKCLSAAKILTLVFVRLNLPT